MKAYVIQSFRETDRAQLRAVCESGVADVDDALLIVPMEEEQKIKLYVNEVKSKFGDKFL